MGVSVRKKDGSYYIFIRHKGERAAQKMVDQQHAEDTKKAVLTAIAVGQFDIAALKKRREAEAEEEKPVLPTLKEYFENIMTPLWEGTLSKETFSRYAMDFKNHILPALGEIPLNELTRDRIKTFVVSLTKKNASKRAHSEEKQKEEANRKLSKDSIRNVVAALRGALGEAVEKGLLVANPATKMGKSYRQARTVREEVDVFTAEEIPLLLNTALEHFGFENYVLLLTLLHSGLRAGEAAGLQWPDLDFRGRFLMVRRQYSDGGHRKTKTRKMRKIDMSDTLLHELQTLKKRRREEYLAKGKNEIPEWVFLSPGQIIWNDGQPVGHTEGRPLQMDNFRNRVYWRACDRAKIRRRRLHDTRHTFASILLMNGESPAYVKEQLGHSSIKMTVDIYGHFIPGSNRQAVNRLPSLTTPAIEKKVAAD